MGKLADLARRAGRWLGLADTPTAPKATTAVVADRFDVMSWRDTYQQASALRELSEELGERYDYSTDLLADVFLGAYKVAPELREQPDMDPSRLVNHQIVSSLVTSPEFTELRRDTAGDPYAAAMAVLAQAPGLRRMLETAREAQRAADHARDQADEAQRAAQAVADAVAAASDQADEDGTVPEDTEAALDEAITAAQHAAQSAAAAAEQAQDEAVLMRAWGIGPGQLERLSFDQRARLAARLRTGRLAQYAELIGRFRQMAGAERARRVEHTHGELVGVTVGDDLSRLVPSELAQLGVPALRPVFAARYAQAELMLYDSRGEQQIGQGAIIACIDCSGSMRHPYAGGITGEAWAKAAALALLDQAHHAKREFAGILFSSPGQFQTFRFPAHRAPDITDVLEFAETFHGGGTDYQTPLSAAVQLLDAEYNTDGRQRGDIVLITDGVCDVTETWMHTWNDAKHLLDFRVFGIAIGDRTATEPGRVLDALCDNLRSIDDLTDTHAAADLFRTI